jgi:anthranilate phosphoribosyltransferase
MMINKILNNLTMNRHLSEAHAMDVMAGIMEGMWSPSQIAGLLIALKMKGETIDEITGFVRTMRQKALSIEAPRGTIDTCGTGGDGSHSFNISTAAALITSAAGIPVAKHGNRSISSKCGSADILQQLGVKIDLTPAQAELCLKNVDITFLFAPVYHGSMKHAAIPRKEMGIRTVFNILGPMSNPANARRQLIGVFNKKTAEKVAKVLKNLQSEHVMVVHSEDGLDEISIGAPTHVIELKEEKVQQFQINPKDLGFKLQKPEKVLGSAPKDNAEILKSVIQGEPSAYLDISLLNSGAAIYISGKVSSLKEGIQVARDIIKSGKAERKLNKLVSYSSSFK